MRVPTLPHTLYSMVIYKHKYIYIYFEFEEVSENYLTINSSSGKICESVTLHVVSMRELECRRKARTRERGGGEGVSNGRANPVPMQQQREESACI